MELWVTDAVAEFPNYAVFRGHCIRVHILEAGKRSDIEALKRESLIFLFFWVLSWCQPGRGITQNRCSRVHKVLGAAPY